ncbi:MAG: PDZ domain-containing protein [Chloroflexi bacterium]|nr:PDZ domain-containing protein [Chloroflexota bacterium]
MRTRTRLIVLLATVPLVAFTLVGGWLGGVVAREDAYRHLRIFEDVVSLISENYVEDADLDEVMDGALAGLAGGLDVDSTFLSAESVARLENGAEAGPAGIGVETVARYYTQIVGVRDDSPADRAGLRPGDYIRAIDDEPTRRLSGVDVVARLRGEPGTTVRLSLLRGNTSEPYDIELTREAPSGSDVSHRMLAAGIGYVRVAMLADGAAAAIEQAAAALAAEGAEQLVIDIRNCAAGSFDEGIAAARLFVAEGTLLQREETGGVQIEIEATAGAGAIDTPVLLLTDFGTAAGAELLAASLTGAGRAESVGQRTAGRVSLQKLIPLPDGSGLWLSWARYLHASGDALHRTGVEPDVAVEVPSVELGEPWPPGDPILDRALEHLQAATPVAAAA